MKKPQPKRVLIVGAGATGLAAAYELQKHNVDVVVVEKSKEFGGLAGGFKVQGTPLEKFYHHLFASDKAAINLINEIGLGDKLKFYPASNGIFYKGKLYPFSSITDMLIKFSPVPFSGRIRFTATSGYLKLTTRWKPLEKELALKWMNKWAGKETTKVIWEPLIRGKFGDRAKEIPMSWLWARIHYRTFRLGYMDGGFQQVYETLAKKIKKDGAQIVMGQGIQTLTSKDDGVQATLENGRKIKADVSLVTVAEPLYAKMTNQRFEPKKSHAHLGATCFVLELNRSLIPYYWLNINNNSFPFLAVVEHSNLVGTKPYKNKHIVYVGNYVSIDDWRFTTDPKDLLEKYIPYIKKINPEFKEDWIEDWHFAKAPFTQPIVTRDYGEHILPNKTDLPNIWLANMAQIYPQDRGQNYAFAMAKKVVKEMLADGDNH
jgi:protoporphyrinogen oxidase